MNKPSATLLFLITLTACGGGNGTSTPTPTPTPPQSTASPTPNPTSSATPSPSASTSPSPTATPGPQSATLKVVSNRADLISGGDVLIQVELDDAADAPQLVVLRDGVDTGASLSAAPATPNVLLGLVEGLQLGENTLTTNFGGSVSVINHPIGGPVFTGPQIQPWHCGNADASDAQCNQPVTYAWLYKSSDPTAAGLLPYDPDNPPADVATTTTDNGETIPFLVREESGYQARDKYTIYTLQKADEAWTPASPQSQWNGRLLVTHGGNCRGDHDTSSPRFDDYAGTIPANPAIEQSYIAALGQGWAVLSTAQLNLGHNCNLSYQAESLLMAKERFVEQYGALRYTVGTGCSGGAITQNMIANAYPGLYQGLLTTCTYPDVMSTATQFADYHILLRYFGTIDDIPAGFPASAQELPVTQDEIAFTTARDGTNFTVAQQNAIYGHPNGIVNAYLANDALFAEAVDPQSSCGGISDEARYHPDTNPSGARCDVLTFMRNIVGPRQRFDLNGNDRWSANEVLLGQGFAGFPLGNQGVQYGLGALQSGLITPAQFLALNVNIGGVDTDLNVTSQRLAPDTPALPNAYRSGILNTIVNMDTVAIINMTGPDPGAAHDSVHGYWVRWRLEREFGHRDNFVHWGGATPLIGNPSFMNDALFAMATWLDAVEADTGDAALANKIISNKPASLEDQCELIPGQMCPEEAMMVFGTPRTVAGDDIYGDQVQCQLRPFSREDDYGFANDGLPAPFADWTEAQWLQLESAFDVNGTPMVCDWSKRPLQWQPTITWLRYQDELGDMITGGQQMSPADYPTGWASAAFRKVWEPGWQADPTR